MGGKRGGRNRENPDRARRRRAKRDDIKGVLLGEASRAGKRARGSSGARAASTPATGPVERSTQHDGAATLHGGEVAGKGTPPPTQQIRVKAGGSARGSRKMTQDERSEYRERCRRGHRH